jgi:sugar phosphate isomerase/epimerase
VSLLLGYNTNGFAHHRLGDALAILVETGYRSVGFTIDVHHPASEFEDKGLLPVVETGARFLLDPRRKHFPTLMSEGRQRRLDFLFECVDVAARIGASCVSLWSGAGDDWALLVDGLRRVCDRADAAGIDVAFEPEPGMLVDTMARFDELRAKLPHPRLGLTLDVGHLFCLEEGSPADWIDRYAPLLRNVHLDDHRRGVHEHLMFGEGGIDFGPVMAALGRAAQGRDLPATVELSRHGHDAVATSRRAFAFLTGPASRPSF